MTAQVLSGKWWSKCYPWLFANGSFSMTVPDFENLDKIDNYCTTATIEYNGIYRFGSKVELPCNITHDNGNDNILMSIPYEIGRLTYTMNIKERKGTYNLDVPHDFGEIILSDNSNTCIIS